MRRFGYLKDRLFVFSLAAYAVNQCFLKPRIGFPRETHVQVISSFLQFHFNDLLLMPAALPVVLWLQRITGLRREDMPPTWPEMLFHLAVWSVMCKFVGPYQLHIGAPDSWDMLYYALGGVMACLWWNRKFEITVNNCPANLPVPFDAHESSR